MKNDQINKDDFIYKSTRPPEEMYQQLLEIVRRADDYYIKSLLHLRLSKIQALPKNLRFVPQERVSTMPTAQGCWNISFPALSWPNFSLHVIRPILTMSWQDVSSMICVKSMNLVRGSPVEYTEEGKLVGHLVKGLELIDRFSQSLEGFPYSMKLHLKHILLSHHGEYQFGSPKLPQTSEAMLVHLIDLMDSKMNAFETIKRTDSQGTDWSRYVKHLEPNGLQAASPSIYGVLFLPKKANVPPLSKALGTFLKTLK